MDNLEDGIFDCIDETAKNEEMLKAMGFADETDIREALKIAKNDINEAVSILTSDRLPRLIGPSKKSPFTEINNNNNENEITMRGESNLDSPTVNKNIENVLGKPILRIESII
jgi:hypothetical protein